MKALSKKTRIGLIAVAVAVVLLLAVLLFLLPELIAPALWTLLLLGLGFLLLELISRRKKKNRQKDFDEKVAAREGIEDRKREWAGWIEELEKQGIDRYELPFYLVVGEPQSGKSVLLQNSDLYFPFGQERLSGVGGTRGCDWWFTDEAVILDIAGRLFTHEGGVADKLEWEAFLDQLNRFRPLCPANGVLLVIPCDALMEDSPEVCADKANKIQSALLTLTQKLQAQLPVYLVLTKGDRVFGFAESVHRLDPEQRHQMFGWSREAEKVERPFVLDEARAGFATLVESARLLRERMIASARLPEALPEIDRLYAFPDELAGLYPALEIYLKRIFTESSLVERASVRGIYLTSGLQTGAPIARVCAELLGDDRESDARALESLFSHQRAYFIKDLVKRRVFVERGLVRPTEGRVLSARRNAMIGYGAAAVLALAAVVGSVLHLTQDRSTEVEKTFQSALAAGKTAVGRTDVRGLLQDLYAIDQAVAVPRELMHEVFSSTRDGFEALYAKVCERALVPTLRRRLEEALVAKAAEDPAAPQDVELLLDDATPLFEELDFGDRAPQELLQRWLPAEWTVRVTDGRGARVDFSVADALARCGGGVSRVGERHRLEALARRLLVLLDGFVDPATPWMTRGHLGYMLAWHGAEAALASLRQAADRGSPDLLAQCDVFANAVDALSAMGQSPKIAGKVTNAGYMNERTQLYGAYLLLSEFLAPGAARPTWSKLETFEAAFAKRTFDQHQSQQQLPKLSLFGGALGRFSNQFQQDLMGTMLAEIPVPPGEVRQWIEDGSGEAAACRAAPRQRWTLRPVVGALVANQGLGRLYVAKVKVMAEQLPTRLPNWAAASADFHGAGAPPAGELDQDLVEALVSLRRQLPAYRLGELPAMQRLADLLAEHLRAVTAAWGTRTDWGPELDWSIPTALCRLVADPAAAGEVAGLANQLCWQYLNRHENRLLEEWRALPPRAEQTLTLLAALNDHLGHLDGVARAFDPDVPVPLDDADHLRWLANVDAELSGRLAVHVEALTTYWRPDTSSWLDLRTTIDGVQRALTADAVRKKVLGVKAVDAPAVGAPELQARQPISTTDKLPLTAEALARLRQFVVPSEADISRHAMANEMKTLLAEVGGQLAADGGKALASTALRVWPLPPANPAPTTVDHYLRPLLEAFADRLVGEVRSRYVREVAALVLARDTRLLDAFYAASPAEIGAVEDLEVLRRLGQLLDVEGQFVVLRRDYGMVADAADPKARHLRPGASFAPPRIEAGWWEFEAFLVGLQRFLTAGETKVADAAFKVRFELPGRAEGVWDIDLTGKQFCYYAVSSAGKGAPGFSQFGDRWEPFEKPLDWAFQSSRRPAMWFVWTHKLRTQGFQWPQDRLDKDISIELTGSLAPLQLAWSGSEEDGRWTVQLSPDGTDEKAKLRLSFQTLDGADLVLPRRPARPTRFP